MKRYITAADIADIAKRPISTVYRWASIHQWRRSADGRRPVLYNAEDVGKTLANLPT